MEHMLTTKTQTSKQIVHIISYSYSFSVVLSDKRKNSLHIRSNSLPSAPHPQVSQFQEHLQRIKDSETATTSFSSSSISQKLSDLQDLYVYADKLVQLPTTQQNLAQECSDKCVDGLLEGSLRLLDICSTAQDCLLRSKENMHVVQSVLRRKGAAGTEFTVEGGKYLTSRKNMNNSIQKALRNLKGLKNELMPSSSNKDKESSSILLNLKEAEAVTLSSLESLLLFVSNNNGQSKKSRWFIISKLMQPARVSCDSQESDTNEFVKVDAALQFLINQKPVSVENLHSHMENLEICIEDLEVGVENLSRQLIRTRVSLLNIFSK